MGVPVLSEQAAGWTVYVLSSSAGERTYVGITRNLQRRLAQHNGDLPGGAKSTRAGRPWTVARIFGPYDDRARAQQIEYAVKQLPRARRLDAAFSPEFDS